MLFVSIEFLIFLPLFFAIYWLLRKKLMWQNLFVIGGSYFFYGWADWRFMGLLAGYTLLSYLSGILLGRTESAVRRKVILWSAVVVNLAVLGLFKYFDFFVNNFNRIFNHFGFDLGWTTLNLVLPIGISFYTFQALSYTIDVYRRDIAPCRNLIPFFAFLSFFPQMVAGPIERASQLLPQFERERTFSYASGVYGMKRILWGLIKKLVIAENCGLVIGHTMALFDGMSSANLWIGAVFFAVQIYCDFSGYSDMAVGFGRLLGIKLSENFRQPFFSHNLKEFWKRWHITMTRWFIDYIYIPLGGSRRGVAMTILNLMIVFTLSGLWHGAGLSFIAWGVYNGVLLVILILVGLLTARLTLPEGLKSRGAKKVGRFVGIVFTFFLFVIGVVIFRNTSLSAGLLYLRRMFEFQGTVSFTFPLIIPTICYIAVFMAVEWFGRNKDVPIDLGYNKLTSHTWVRWTYYWAISIIAFLLAAQQTNFIYFQF